MKLPTREETRLWAVATGLLPDNSHPMPETRYMKNKLDLLHKLVMFAFIKGTQQEKKRSKKEFHPKAFGPVSEPQQRNSEIGFTGGY